MTKLRKWKLSDIGKGLVNAFLAILQGKLLLKLNATRYFIHILYTFFIFWISIWLSLKIEKTLTKVEDNRRILSDIEIYRAQKTVELAGYSRLRTVQDMLKDAGSNLDVHTKPADRIKK